MRVQASARCLLVTCTAALVMGSLSATATAGPAAALPFDVDGNSVADLVVGAPGEDLGGTKDAGTVTFFRGSSSDGVTGSAVAVNQNSAGIRGAAEAGDRFGAALASGDFDRDGYADVAVGAPGEGIGTVRRAGAVSVIYGSAGGPSTRDQLWSQSSSGVPGSVETDGAFGFALAAGDLDGDGYADLAIGAPATNVGAAPDAGSVTILYGGGGGLSTTRVARFTQDTPGIAEVADVYSDDYDNDSYKGYDNFGGALAAGDTTGDGLAELLVGVPGESVEKEGDDFAWRGGAVHVLLGRGGGVTAEGSQLWTQDSDGVDDVAEHNVGPAWVPEEGDEFGAALAIGDVNGDGKGDAVVGVPGEDIKACDQGPCRHGAVHVLPGTPDGLSGAGSQFLHQDTPGIPGVPGSEHLGTRFGAAVAAGDTDGDGNADIAVSAPGHSGAVFVLRGSAGGITTAGAQYWEQNTSGVPGGGEARDHFGASISLLQLGRGGAADLAVGVPGENDGRGVVHVLYGSGSGLTTTATRLLSQDSPGVPGTPEAGDAFALLR